MRSISKLLVAALLVLTIAPSLMAQGFQIGSITGIVTDQTGGALPGVTVTVTNMERKSARTDVTDSNGRYRFASLPLAPYKVEAVLTGFSTAIRQNVHVEADKTTIIDMSLKLAAATEAITVTAAAPVVDPTNQAQTTRLSTREYEKAPVGRNYQSIAALAPGVSATNGGNPYSNGANYTANQFLFDGVDATDPTTGTFAANINFEAIQEVNVFTSGVSAEYGRATGAIVSVVTKSGTNQFDGSLKVIGTNDNWNSQNKTVNPLTGASFARTKVEHNNIRYSATIGGPIWKDHVWFFGALEKYKPLTSPGTTTYTNENYSSTENSKLENYRASWQVSPSHQLWAKFNQDPYTGILNAYTEPTDLYTLTLQGQGGKTKVGQYSGVFGSSLSLDAMFGTSTSVITVDPFKIGPYDNGAAIVDLGIGKYFNGNYFGLGNFVERPKKQFVIAGTYFATLGANTHEFKVGIDSESVKSTSYYTYGNNRRYSVNNYNPATGTFTPYERYDFVNPGPQTSKGQINSLYARDKFVLGKRLNLEAGLRFEQQNGHNDVGTKVVDAKTVAPRLSGSYDLKGNGRTLVLATAGRYYDFLIQSFSDQYAQSASRANYDLYSWNTQTNKYDFVQRVITASGSTLPVSLGLKPNKLDEFTVGVEQQFGSTMGVTVRGISRKWKDVVEDFIEYNAAGNPVTTYHNSSKSERNYRALQFQFDKRFTNNWSMLANYTFARTRGNYFATTASAQGDYLNSNCKVSSDATVGTIPCSQVMSRASGKAPWDVPHVLNVLGTYGFKLGRVNLTYGLGGLWRSGLPYSKVATAQVIRPDGTTSSTAYSYYYQGIGSDRLPNVYQIDNSLDASFGVFRGVELGVKGEIFNITDSQVQTAANRTTWCEAQTTACATTRSQFGAPTARGSFLGPRSYRATFFIRF